MRCRLVLLCIPLAACTGFDAAQCRAADWYDFGFRDAMHGLQRQEDLYAFECEGQAKVDVARYAQGWREGRWEADSRSAMSAD